MDEEKEPHDGQKMINAFERIADALERLLKYTEMNL